MTRRRVGFFSLGNKQRAWARHSLSVERSSKRVKLCLFVFVFTMLATRLHGKRHSTSSIQQSSSFIPRHSSQRCKGSRRPSFETLDHEETEENHRPLQVDILLFSVDSLQLASSIIDDQFDGWIIARTRRLLIRLSQISWEWRLS